MSSCFISEENINFEKYHYFPEIGKYVSEEWLQNLDITKWRPTADNRKLFDCITKYIEQLK